MNDLEAIAQILQKVNELYDRQGLNPGVSSTVLDAGDSPGSLSISNGSLNQVLTKNPNGSVTIARSLPNPPSPPIITSSDNDGRAIVSFSYGDATPKIIYSISAGKTVLKAQITITQPFNGDSSVLRLGDGINPERLITALQNNSAIAGSYTTNPVYTYTASTDILLAILPGVGCTQGSGLILLEFS